MTKTWHIHIEGQVQGVGFRPFVYLLALKHRLNGWVNNTTDGVHIEINAPETAARQFYGQLLEQAPVLSSITGHRMQEAPPQSYDRFDIVHSESAGEARLLLTPDFALCADCRAELYAPGNRRQGYPFITCTNCGPRFSIQRRLPYDRKMTSMDVFPMCPRCAAEYDDPANRRYFSQTNSCPLCPIALSLLDGQQSVVATDIETVVDLVADCWEKGGIVAIKGIGGYLITCDAANPAAVRTLRQRKHRPTKPFALMFPDLPSLEQIAIVRPPEAAELLGHVSPVVLLDVGEDPGGQLALDDIAPGIRQIGAMLPYTPLYDLLLKKFARPIVATSANVSHSPIVFQDEKARAELGQLADSILTNNRDIVVPQDDSVLKYATFSGRKIVMRRARGLAPTYINAQLEWPSKTIFAAGALLKSTFALLHQGNTYISQYLGDLEHFDTAESYAHTARHFFDLFRAQPAHILCDKHPDYASTRFAHELASQWGVQVEPVQHHVAHFGAILGEHHLLEPDGPVLGVIWDGTGLGDDGHVWGGEFFRYENHQFARCAQFDYFDFILGDKMPKEPRISALSACWGIEGADNLLHHQFSPAEWRIYNTLLEKGGKLQTSSVGRIFDAAASLMGIMDKQTYEGEAAMRLEALALGYFKKQGLDFPAAYFPDEAVGDGFAPAKSLMAGIVQDLNSGVPRDFVAAKFHFSLVKLLKIVANKQNIGTLAFSGGVFQNSLLVDLIGHHLSKEFRLYFHEQLSPNDENISFGQLVCHLIQQQKAAG